MLSLSDFAAAASLFPTKLYRMVNDAQCQCMNWGGEGEHLILNTRDFEDELLQNTVARWKYQLKTTSTTSFIRQLHAYGFRKVIDGFDIGGTREPSHVRRYFHPYFHRARPDLLMYMKRSIRTNPSKRQSKISEQNRRMQQVAHCSIAGGNGVAPIVDRPMLLPPQVMGVSPQTMTPPMIECGASAEAMGIIEPNSGPTPNKRRRKAPPRRHPSFSRDSEMENEADLSPPTMVTRSQFRSNKSILEKYPELAESPGIDSKVSKTQKTTSGSEDDEFSDEKPIEIIDPVKEEVTTGRSAVECNDQSSVKEDEEDTKRAGGEAVDDDDEAMDEPLDLSQRSHDQDKSEIPSNIAQQEPPNNQQVVKQLPLRQQPATPKATVNTIARNLNHQVNGSACYQPPPPPPNIIPQPMHQPLINHQPPMQMGCGAARMFSQGLPPFPATNTRIAVPQHCVLQPAYIAWPTRGVFCPQTKQWIQSRPTIIPLPFKSHPISPLKQESMTTRPGIPFGQHSWAHESPRIARPAKEQHSQSNTRVEKLPAAVTTTMTLRSRQ